MPVFDHKGQIRHDGGVVEMPGLYVLGLPFLRRRKSSLIDGVGDDARELSTHLAAYLRKAATNATAAPASGSKKDATGIQALP
jgi:putative flavoprotein involved in K+ transport